MSDSDDRLGSESDRAVERGEEYDHDEYGRVEVTGIWKGVHQVDAAHNAKESGVIIVRYMLEDGEKHVDELTDTLEEFLAAVE